MTQTLSENRVLLSGNEAVACGAYDAGMRVATAYPGTPSTEILENVAARFPDVNSEWSPNEKVALEVGMGAAFAGARVLTTMKHVGLNVAADPLFTLSYTGTRGGIVIVTADDPAMHSSQNEQDNRFYAPFAEVPMLEPVDSQEAYDFTRMAFDISEQFDAPVLLRMTTRVCHGKSVVVKRDPVEPVGECKFERDREKLVMIPAFARKRHAIVKERTRKLREWAETTDANRADEGSGEVGVIADGVAYEYVKEVAPDIPCLKIGMVFPLPEDKIRSFASRFSRVIVMEELEPYLENNLRAMGLEVDSKPAEMRLGELNPDLVADVLGVEHPAPKPAADIPGRPPVLCPGCPHRAVYTVLKKLKMIVTGDIGCYTLGALPPLTSLDTCVCMGAGVGHALGLSKVLSEEDRKKVVAVIGDSTFVHSGITPLIDMVYNGGDCTVLILDNGTTAMTGRQDHPATGRTLKKQEAPRLDLEGVCRSVGVEHVAVVNPWDLTASEEAIKAAVAHPGPAVVIERGPCLLTLKQKDAKSMKVDPAKCVACGLCARTGCPAISEADGSYVIDPLRCRGCELCSQLCRFGAINPLEVTSQTFSAGN